MPTTKDGKVEVRKYIVSRFSSLSREILKAPTDDKNKKKHLEKMEEDCYHFQSYLEKEVNSLSNIVPRSKALVDSVLLTYLQCFGCKDRTIDVETTLKRLYRDSDAETLLHYVKSVRLAGTKKLHETSPTDYEDDEVTAILFLTLSILEKLYQSILASALVPSTPKSLFSDSPRNNSPTKNTFKLEIDDLEFSSNGTVILVNEKDHPTVCMENACGLPCYRHCKEHNTEKLVYLSFTGIGTVKCNFADDCKKNKKIFRMSNGTEVSVCPYLHGDQFDEIKARIGQGWLAYSRNQISFPEIFAIADPKSENGKVNLVNSKRCKFLPCMENACGATCNHHCAEHSDEKNVFYSYTKIGSEKCEYGPSCKKYQKNILLRDGRTCNQCPFLHGDSFDEVKKRIGLGWTLYASGIISYDQVFNDEDLSHHAIPKFLL